MNARRAIRSLQEEIGQTVPFRSAGQEAVLAIERTADVIARRYELALAPYDVTLAQYNALRILRGARGKPLRTLEVSERMIQRTPGITRMIDRLEAKGLVRREACSHDRRIVYCVITDAGMDLLAATDDLVIGLDEELGAVLGSEELTLLIDRLGRLRAAAESGR